MVLNEYVILRHMLKNKDFSYSAAIVLGMHDAIVSLMGTIVGLVFALENATLIVLTAGITAITASLSMAASNYLAQRSQNDPDAVVAGIYTGVAYLITSALLILPFIMLDNIHRALAFSLIFAVLIIFIFNCWSVRGGAKKILRRFIEMLIICAGVSIVAFIIGAVAHRALGISI